MKLCQYKDILGKPKKGIHSIRFFDIAVADVVMSIVGAFLIKYALDIFLNKKVSIYLILFIVFSSGIILHKLFCVDTTINKLIFKNKDI
tara:strand:- start:200 stop:466 length:267 start_codon:yes stop_codon:yes gene_type:complete